MIPIMLILMSCLAQNFTLQNSINCSKVIINLRIRTEVRNN